MINKDVVRALKCVAGPGMDNCGECYYSGRYCYEHEICADALELINQQQKEIEKLNTEIRVLKQKRVNLFERLEIVETTKSEVIKEFAKKLKVIGTQEGAYDYVSVFEIDTVAKEMGVTYDEL